MSPEWAPSTSWLWGENSASPNKQELMAGRSRQAAAAWVLTAKQSSGNGCQGTLEEGQDPLIFIRLPLKARLCAMLYILHLTSGLGFAIPIVQMKKTEAPGGLVTCPSLLCVRGRAGFGSSACGVRAQALLSLTLERPRRQDPVPRGTGKKGWHT